MRGVYHINGKQLDNIDELEYIYDHYEELFQVVSRLTRRQLDADMARVNRELAILNQMYDERVAHRAWTIDARIRALDSRAMAAGLGGGKLRLMARAFGLRLYRGTYIHRPLRAVREEIRRKEADRDELIDNGPVLIEGYYRKLRETYDFIRDNRPLLERARLEAEVIRSLSKLGDDYHVINNVRLGQNDRLPARFARRQPAPCDIAHIVVGPTGLFLIIVMPSGDPRGEQSQQCLRQALCVNRSVTRFLRANDLSEYEVKPRTVLVTLNGSCGGEALGESVDIVSLDRLSMYLKHRNNRITGYSVDEIVGLFNR